MALTRDFPIVTFGLLLFDICPLARAWNIIWLTRAAGLLEPLHLGSINGLG